MPITKVCPKKKCPTCSKKFDLTRKDKNHCSPSCRKNASKRKSPKTDRVRTFEYRNRNSDHYERAMWLTYDVHHLLEPERNLMIQRLL